MQTTMTMGDVARAVNDPPTLANIVKLLGDLGADLTAIAGAAASPNPATIALAITDVVKTVEDIESVISSS